MERWLVLEPEEEALEEEEDKFGLATLNLRFLFSNGRPVRHFEMGSKA